MKKILFIVAIFAINILTAQTYSFSKLTKKVIVQTSSGKQQRVVGTNTGNYNFVFENMNSSKDRLFTLLSPGQINGPGLPWYNVLYDNGYLDFKGKTAKVSVYYYTETQEKLTIMFTDDFSDAVFLWSDGRIWEFSR